MIKDRFKEQRKSIAKMEEPLGALICFSGKQVPDSQDTLLMLKGYGRIH